MLIVGRQGACECCENFFMAPIPKGFLLGVRLLSDGFKNGMVQQKPEVTFDRGGVKEFEDKTLLCMFLSNLTEDAAQNV